MGIESGDSVTIEYTGRFEDGTVFDTSRKSVAEDAGLAEEEPDRTYKPLTATVGTGEFIEGLEDALTGMEPGETATITVPPEEGYGEWTEDNVREYETAALDQHLADVIPEEGEYVQIGEGTVGKILTVNDESIRVDFNHRLAGKTITFDIEVLDVQ